MKYFLILLVWFFVGNVSAQVSTIDNYSGIWSATSSWFSGIQPNPISAAIKDGITVNGYITRQGSLSFANVNQANDFVINDTLIIMNDLTFANKATNLKIPNGGLLIVFGNFSADNKIEVDNGGLLIVMGNMSFSNSPQDDYIDNGGGLYVDGTVNGNTTADGIDLPISSLLTDGFDDIYDFVTSGGSTPLPVELLSFSAKTADNSVVLNWATASELNNDFFTLEKSRNGKDFEFLATVDGNGSSHSRIDYSFMDKNPYLGLSYYRLSQTDYDGTSEVFPAISLLNTKTKNLSIYPNPVSSHGARIRATGKPANSPLTLNIYNIQGRIVYQSNYTADVFGNLDEEIDTEKILKSGTYILELISLEGKDLIKFSRE